MTAAGAERAPVAGAVRPAPRRLSLLTLMAFGIGQSAEGMKNAAFNTFVLFFYQQVVGVSGLLTGIALGIALVCDAITDPLAGALSDRAKTRWGRRHPFIALSAIPLAITFYLLFNPPAGLSEFEAFLWLTTFAVLVRTAMTAYHIPHLALGAEMAHDYNQRSTLFAFSTVFGILGGSLSAFFAYRLFFPTTKEFDPGLLNAAGYSGYALTFACAMVVAIALCVLGTVREIPHLRVPARTSPLSLRRILRELRDVLRNPSFRAIFVGMLLSALILSIEAVFQPFMGVHFWGLRTEQLAFLPLAALAGLVLAIPVTPVVTRWLDKRLALVVPAIIIIVNGNVLIVLRLLDAPFLPANSSDWILRLVMIATFIGAMGATVVFASLNSMFADIADEHELETGERREGIIFAARAFSVKATGAIGLMIGGAALDLIAFPRGAEMGTVAADTVWYLGFIQGPATSVFTILGVLMFLGYRLDRERHAQIMTALEARRRDR